MQLSFSMKTATPAVGIFIVILALLGCLGPVAYFAWWGFFYDGPEADIPRNIEKLISSDPEERAEAALNKKDYRLFCTGGRFDPSVPGIGVPEKAYRVTFGYLGFSIYEGEQLLAEEQVLNARALKYMRQYNSIVYAEVNTIHPDWQRDFDKEKGSR